ncbi:2-hydroxyhepta-2,4-diene-1,7-dioate isomerase, partial [Herbaspirillum sp. HC18]
MKLPRLATYSVKGDIGYGAVLEGGIVDLSARHARDYPTLREVIAAGKLVSFAEEAAGRKPDHALGDI